MPESDLTSGLINFAAYPPDETDFLTTRSWDKCLPGWRAKVSYIDHNDSDYNKSTIDMINSCDGIAPGVHSHDEQDVDKLHHVTIKRMVHPKKGKCLRFSREVIEQILKDKNEAGEPSQG